MSAVKQLADLANEEQLRGCRHNTRSQKTPKPQLKATARSSRDAEGAGRSWTTHTTAEQSQAQHDTTECALVMDAVPPLPLPPPHL